MMMRESVRRLTQVLCVALAAVAAAGWALAQADDAPALGITGLAQTTLASVVQSPLHFRLLEVSVGGGETTRYAAAEQSMGSVSRAGSGGDWA